MSHLVLHVFILSALYICAYSDFTVENRFSLVDKNRALDKLYFYNDESVDWGRAGGFCHLNGGQLWQPDSHDELVLVKSKLSSSISSVWLGLSPTWPERDFESGRAYSYSNWESSRPTSGVAYMRVSDLKWVDANDNDKSRALCESKSSSY